MVNDNAHPEEDKQAQNLGTLGILFLVNSEYDLGDQNLECHCLSSHPAVSLPDDDLWYSLEYRR